MPKVLMVGAAPLRLTECAVEWLGCWWETVPSQLGQLVGPQADDGPAQPIDLCSDAFVEFAAMAREFDVVSCEPPEALLLHAESIRRGAHPPDLVVLAVRGLDESRQLLGALPEQWRALCWRHLIESDRVAWIAASDAQHRVLLDAGIPAEHVHRVNASVCVYRAMIPDAGERLRPDASIDEHLAPSVPSGAVLVAGTGHRDTETWLTAASLLPDVPFVSVGPSRAEITDHVDALGIGHLDNVHAVSFLPLEEFIAAIRRSRICVVCLQPGEGDGGHTTTCLAHALGVPVVASRIDGVVDYVEDGRSARVVPPRDPRALATAIRWLWEDRRARERFAVGGREAETARGSRTEDALRHVVHRSVARSAEG